MSRNRSDASAQHTFGPVVRSSADTHAGSATDRPLAGSNDTPFVLGAGANAVAAGSESGQVGPVGTQLAGSDDGAPMVVCTDSLSSDGAGPGA